MDREILLPKEPNEDNMIIHDSGGREGDYSDSQEFMLIQYGFCSPIVYGIYNSVGLVSCFDEFMKDTELWGFDKLTAAK
jgi:hypothetical protein